MNQNNLSRRDFLKFSALGTCALCLSACGHKPAAVPMEYWQEKKTDLMKDFDEIMKNAEGFINENISTKETGQIMSESRERYLSLLPEVPYIGGDDNSLTEVLYMSAVALALYEVMKTHHQTLEETGRVLYRTMEKMFSFNDPLMAAQIRNPTGKEEQNEYRRMERYLSKSRYLGDWKMTFVEGDGVNFDFGVDYTECGVVKFYKAHNAYELTKYMCLGDYPISQSIGSGLVRTTTLGNGGPRCDFRFKAGRPIRMEWTPDFLKK
ncbi:L-2-amino-thiazoline-4-carboxylic acid hydrolase [Leptolinea tardivitalis]|uniref:L-2-amino-thiazoline-4-carboxylic acid hydrolase n=1 Tax=Leptolinea tardivitalis TaxID=229920 RepID=UPI000785E4E7|nr:L-2-amino-thiazoline-4-carboxylic acid hydrolase [Leptolinea tardivitalis]GAP21374.1 L-2-amino-thiazoline-4-carboxylic acid hydrolase [Leptolinea tardivitalis]